MPDPNNALKEALAAIEKEQERAKSLVHDLCNQTPVNDPPKRGTHDTTDTKKGPVLEVATSDSGKQRSFFFEQTCNWRWRSIAKTQFLEIMGENNFIIAQFRADTVVSITNGQYLFRDSSWR